MDFRQLWRRLRHPRKPAPLTSAVPPANGAAKQIEHYLQNGRRPWSRGYRQYKDAFIQARLADPDFLARLRRGDQLPAGYGEFLDERVVEYPWLFSRLGQGAGRLLDAGSVLNFPHIVTHPALTGRQITILTLAPENHCFWQRSISYVFGDIRALPFRDGWFDEIICLSTLEHVGKDNTRVGYSGDARLNQDNAEDFLLAVAELKRVCKPGGRVLVSVPYGKFSDFGWYQQFDARLLGKLIAAFAPSRLEETYFRYVDGGWRIAAAEECAACEGFDIHATRYMDPTSTKDYDPDFAACSRGIAALELHK